MPLNPPASTNTIVATERVVGVALPAGFREFLLDHDGEMTELPWRAGRHRLLTAGEIANEWGVWSDLLTGGDLDGRVPMADKGVRDAWWHPGWIPFTTNGAGDSYCLDLAPALGGTKGQVITLWHDDGARRVIAASFQDWLDAFGSG